MRDVAVIGVGMTRFGKFPDRGIKDLVREAVLEAVKDSGIRKKDIGAAYVGNAAAGLMTGQEMIRGQVTLSPLGIEGIPVFNVENACASSSTAFHLGWLGVASGMYDCVLVVGFEKLYHPDKRKSFHALSTGIDVETGSTFLQDFAARKGQKAEILKLGSGTNRSIFMDMYTYWVRPYMENFGLTREHFARISVKNHRNGSLNPHAQYQEEVTPGGCPEFRRRGLPLDADDVRAHRRRGGRVHPLLQDRGRPLFAQSGLGGGLESGKRIPAGRGGSRGRDAGSRDLRAGGDRSGGDRRHRGPRRHRPFGDHVPDPARHLPGRRGLQVDRRRISWRSRAGCPPTRREAWKPRATPWGRPAPGRSSRS